MINSHLADKGARTYYGVASLFFRALIRLRRYPPINVPG